MRYVLRALVSIAFLMAACDRNPTGPRPEKKAREGEFAVITTTDFQVGSVSVVWLDDAYTIDKDVATIHADAVTRFFDGFVYVVNRLGADNIQILNPADGFSTVRQFSVGNGADPHDIAVVSETKAYVTRYNSSDLWIVDPSTGAHTGSISLAGFADDDGIPEMDRLLLTGNRLFVSVQRLDRNAGWGPVGSSYLAVVDVLADTLVDADPGTPGTQAIALEAVNPVSEIKVCSISGNLYVACAGNWGIADGGVEVINPVTLKSEGIVLAGTTVGGSISDVELVSAEAGYAIFSDANFHNVLVRFDAGTGAVTDTLYAPGGFVLQGIKCAQPGLLFLADRSATRPGIRLFDIETQTQITAAPICVGLPPFDITFGVSDGGAKK